MTPIQLKSQAETLLASFKMPKDLVLPKLSNAELALKIDHTLLKTDALNSDIAQLVAEAYQYKLKAVCTQPIALPTVLDVWQKTSQHQPAKAVVIGFPQGANLAESKAAEIQAVLKFGVDELDVVAPISLIKSGEWAAVEKELIGLRVAAGGGIVKLIFETCLLSDLEIAQTALLALAAGLDCFKTSTGFSTGGATERHVALLTHLSGGKAFVKASGGIKNRSQALRMIALGAARLGTSSALSILSDGTSEKSY